jgi:hypothetical protein
MVKMSDPGSRIGKYSGANFFDPGPKYRLNEYLGEGTVSKAIYLSNR